MEQQRFEALSELLGQASRPAENDHDRYQLGRFFEHPPEAITMSTLWNALRAWNLLIGVTDAISGTSSGRTFFMPKTQLT